MRDINKLSCKQYLFIQTYSMKIVKYNYRVTYTQLTSLACGFCFPKSDHVMLLLRTVSFKCRLMYVLMYE